MSVNSGVTTHELSRLASLILYLILIRHLYLKFVSLGVDQKTIMQRQHVFEINWNICPKFVTCSRFDSQEYLGDLYDPLKERGY